jgi:NDP-sugar pyrophosphorylase family protein
VSDCLENIDVVVLAGGLGSRLSKVLKDKPKLLAPLGESSYLMFLLAWLKNFGARRVIFGLGHLAESVVDYLDANSLDDIEISVVIEKRPMGTAGAIANLRSQIKTNPVLIMNGDSFVDADLCVFLDFHRREKADVSILCTQVRDSGRYGLIRINSDNRVLEFQEKCPSAGEGVINAGVYLFGPNSLNDISKNGESLEKDFFPNQPIGHVVAMCGRYDFLDIGTPADLARAPSILRKYYN